MAELVQEFVDQITLEVRKTWPALLNLLTLDHVVPDLVQYPPAPPGGDVFDFWKGSSGQRLPNVTRPLIQLPDAALEGSDQVLNASRDGQAQ